MKYALAEWRDGLGWDFGAGFDLGRSDLVLYFGAPHLLASGDPTRDLRTLCPHAHLLGCSTGGEILGIDVGDDGVVAAAIAFDRTPVRTATVKGLARSEDSHDCGRGLGEGLRAAGPEGQPLRGVFILSDGTRVNGTALLRGVAEAVGRGIPITGGLAGDGDRFQTTLVGCDEVPASGTVAAVGFYGDAIDIRHGCRGGWDPFGPERLITRAEGNVLYELDGQPALALYKRYLGDEARDLPGSALLFPLAVRPPEAADGQVVRTIVGIDEARGGMIFAGDVPEGHIARLMKGNFDRLVAGAESAAALAAGQQPLEGALAVLISCIGRKLLLGQRISEEVEATQQFLGLGVGQIGFYSYGEISPHVETKGCELHNQTMTITLLMER